MGGAHRRRDPELERAQPRPLPKPSHKSDALRKALANSGMTIVDRLLAEGADWRATPSRPWSALWDAMRDRTTRSSRRLRKVKRLLSLGADADERGQRGANPLKWCYGRDAAALAKVLISAGAVPDAAEAPNAVQPIHVAAEHGEAGMIEVLLDRGASVDAATRQGATPIMIAAEHKQTPAVEVLLRRGADTDAVDELGRTVLEIALRCEDDATIELLTGRPADEVYDEHYGDYDIARLRREIVDGFQSGRTYYDEAFGGQDYQPYYTEIYLERGRFMELYEPPGGGDKRRSLFARDAVEALRKLRDRVGPRLPVARIYRRIAHKMTHRRSADYNWKLYGNT